MTEENVSLLVTIILTLIAVKYVDSLCDCRLFINNCYNMITYILIYYTIVLLALLPSRSMNAIDRHAYNMHMYDVDLDLASRLKLQES